MPSGTPIRPDCAFRVAVTGHRWDRLPLASKLPIQTAISAVLEQIGETVSLLAAENMNGYSGSKPELVLLTGLAEGADRLGAAAANSLKNWRVHAVLPFAEAAYVEDFQGPDSPEGSLQDFKTLLRTCGDVTVLDGIPKRFDAYLPLSRVLVDQADLLIVIWDGQPGRGPGGTTDVIARARREDVPIVRITADAAAEAWLENLDRKDAGASEKLSALNHRVTQLLAPPMTPKGTLDAAGEYFMEAIPRRPPSRWFQTIVSLCWQRPGESRSSILRILRGIGTRSGPSYDANPEAALEREWQTVWAGVDPAVRTEAFKRFGAHQAWADTLATWYAAEFRGAFARVFALSWLAVGAAYLSSAAELIGGTDPMYVLAWFGRIFEVGVLIFILMNVRTVRRQRLHERWLDYRSLAERLRHLSFLWPLGRATPLLRVPAAPVLGDPRLSWVGWMLRAVTREAGLVPTEWNAKHLAGCRQLVRDGELVRQHEFHEATLERAIHVNEKLERFAEGLFWVALALAGIEVFVVAMGIGVAQPMTALFGGLAVAMPALGAGIHGFLGTADLEGTAIRSSGLAPRLSDLIARIDRNTDADMTAVGEIAAEAAQLMETDLSTWHQVTASRRLQAG